MAEGLVFESSVVRRYKAGGSAALTLSDESAVTKWLVRAARDGSAADHLGVAFGASVRRGDALVLGSRPGEWIVLGAADAVAATIDSLRQAAGSEFVTALDWTHGRALFRVTGPDASRMLEKVCSLDWSDAMTPDGAVASASVAKVTCDTARDDANGMPSYLVLCDRSFGQYLFDALLDAGDEFGIAVASAGS